MGIICRILRHVCGIWRLSSPLALLKEETVLFFCLLGLHKDDPLTRRDNTFRDHGRKACPACFPVGGKDTRNRRRITDHITITFVTNGTAFVCPLSPRTSHPAEPAVVRRFLVGDLFASTRSNYNQLLSSPSGSPRSSCCRTNKMW